MYSYAQKLAQIIIADNSEWKLYQRFDTLMWL